MCFLSLITVLGDGAGPVRLTLPANLDVVLHCVLRFLMERVEYINCFLELGNIENTIGIISMNTNFLTTRTHRRNRLEVGSRSSIPIGPLATLSQLFDALLMENAAHRHAMSRSMRCLTCQIGYTFFLPCDQNQW